MAREVQTRRQADGVDPPASEGGCCPPSPSRSMSMFALATIGAAVVAAVAVWGAVQGQQTQHQPVAPSSSITQPAESPIPSPSSLPNESSAIASHERELTGDFRIVRSFPHDSSAFTQGLGIWEGRLYETTGLYGQSSIRELDRETGSVLRRAQLPNSVFGEGLALFPGNTAKVLTWKAGTVLRYNLSSFALLDQQPISTSTGEGWGFAFDGKDVYVSDGSSYLMRAAADTLQETSRTIVRDMSGTPVRNLNELEWVLGEVLANVWFQSFVARIDPGSGRVIGAYDLSSLAAPPSNGNNVLNGIACDPDTYHDEEGVLCYFTGKQWPTMYEARLASRPRSTAGSR